jgi:hypothetical protein
VLPCHRWRRRADPDLGRAGERFQTKPVYILGTGESVETPMVSQMEDFTSSRAFRVAGPDGVPAGRHQRATTWII